MNKEQRIDSDLFVSLLCSLSFFSVLSVSPWLILLSSFVKRQRHDDGRVLRAADVDGQARADGLGRWADVGHRDRPLERRRKRAARDFADRFRRRAARRSLAAARACRRAAGRRGPVDSCRRRIARAPRGRRTRGRRDSPRNFKPGLNRIDRLRTARGRTAAWPLRAAACRGRRGRPAMPPTLSAACDDSLPNCSAHVSASQMISKPSSPV